MRLSPSHADREYASPDAFRIFLWLLLVAEAIAAIIGTRPWLMGDSGVYLQLAKGISEGSYGTVTAHGLEPDALRPPGYPLLLALLLFVIKLPPVAVVIIQAAAYLASLFLLERLLIGWQVNPAPFLVLALAYPFGLAYGLPLATEAWATLGVTTVSFLLVRVKRLWGFAALGAVAGLAALVRSDLLLLPLLIAAVMIIDGLHNRPSIATARAVSILIGAVAMLTPYAAWNFAHFGRFSPIPQAGAAGPSLYLATWQRHLPLDDTIALLNGHATERAERSGLAPEVRSINRRIGVAPETGPWNPAIYPNNATRIRMAQLFGQAARRRIAADPAAYANHVVRNIWDLWNSGRYPEALPPFGVIGLTIISGIVFLLGMGGAALTVWRRKAGPVSVALVVILLYPMAIHVWLHTEARYTAAARPLLLMFAGIMVGWLLAQWRAFRDESQPHPALSA